MPRKRRGLRSYWACRVRLVDLNRALADRIANGEVDLQTPGLAEHLWQTTMDKLAVDQPNYASYKTGIGEQGRSNAPSHPARHSGMRLLAQARNPSPDGGYRISGLVASRRPGMTK